MNQKNKRIIIVLALICFMFISLIVYLSYFQVFVAEGIKNNSYNKRLWINEESVLRGSITDRNNRVLAYSEKQDERYKRYYKYGQLYSHIIGYSDREFGKTGLELEYNNILLDINENAAINEFKNLIAPSAEGNKLRLTIDHELQERGRALLKGKKGSIVAMNPSTGEIYAMVSLPDFNASKLKEDWKTISEDPTSPLINRATQGLYAPGSIFKLISASTLLNMPNLDLNYECTGSTKIDGYIFKDYQDKGHGPLDLKKALVHSCNTYFAMKVSEIGWDKMGNTADRFLFNKKIPFDLPVKTSTYLYRDNLGKTELAASAIGQGKVLVTPLNMVLMTSAIANNGEIVKPILVKEVISPKDRIIKTIKTETLSRAISFELADEIKNMMVEAVQSGTGTNARIKNVKVAGKTGTAENPSGKSHAWFVGFAPADNPKIAVSVILEEEGSTGGKGAAPIARDIMLYVINNIKD